MHYHNKIRLIGQHRQTLLRGPTNGKTLDPKEIVTVQELAISNMLEIGALRELLFEKGIIREQEFIERYKRLTKEMKERRDEIKTTRPSS